MRERITVDVQPHRHRPRKRPTAREGHDEHLEFGYVLNHVAARGKSGRVDRERERATWCTSEAIG